MWHKPIWIAKQATNNPFHVFNNKNRNERDIPDEVKDSIL